MRLIRVAYQKIACKHRRSLNKLAMLKQAMPMKTKEDLPPGHKIHIDELGFGVIRFSIGPEDMIQDEYASDRNYSSYGIETIQIPLQQSYGYLIPSSLKIQFTVTNKNTAANNITFINPSAAFFFSGIA